MKITIEISGNCTNHGLCVCVCVQSDWQGLVEAIMNGVNDLTFKPEQWESNGMARTNYNNNYKIPTNKKNTYEL